MSQLNANVKSLAVFFLLFWSKICLRLNLLLHYSKPDLFKAGGGELLAFLA